MVLVVSGVAMGALLAGPNGIRPGDEDSASNDPSATVSRGSETRNVRIDASFALDLDTWHSGRLTEDDDVVLYPGGLEGTTTPS